MSAEQTGLGTAQPVLSEAEPEHEHHVNPSEKVNQDGNDPVPGNVNEEDIHHGWKLVLLMLGICLGNFLGGFDFTVTATAVPVITSYFNSLEDVGWYGSAYYMAFCVCLPLAGKIYSLFPKKITYLSYVGVFALGSLICGVAPTSNALIVGRAIAGVGGSGLSAGCLAILAVVVPLHRRPMLTGIANSCFGVAQIVGPLVGGAFAEKVTWRWCFYINLPICGVVAVAVFFVLSLKKAESEKQPLSKKLISLDVVGFVLLAGSIIMLLIALEYGGEEYAWNSSVIIGLFVGFGVTLIVFGGWQRYLGDTALIPIQLFKNRTAALAVCTGFLGCGGFQAIVYYLPIWFQAVLGASPISSGIRYLPCVISDVLTSIIGGGIVMAIGTYKPFHLLGLCCLSVGGGLLSTLHPNINEGKWIGYQILCGMGYSFSLTMPIVAVQSILPPDLIPISAASIMFGVIGGGAICLGIAQTIFDNVLHHNLLQVVTPAEASQIVSAGASKLQDIIREDGLNATAVDNAYSKAVTDTFYIPAASAACAFLLALGMQWTNIKHKKPPSGVKPEQPVEEDPQRSQSDSSEIDDKKKTLDVIPKKQSMLYKLRRSIVK